MGKLNLDAIFTHHAPFGTQLDRYVQLRSAGRQLTEKILAVTPASREQSLAVTAVQQAIMWANAAIAINEVAPVVEVDPLDSPEGAAFAEAHLGVVGEPVTAPEVAEAREA